MFQTANQYMILSRCPSKSRKRALNWKPQAAQSQKNTMDVWSVRVDLPSGNQSHGLLENTPKFIDDCPLKISIWRFPKIGVPLKSSILIECSTKNHPCWGTPI